MAIWGAIIGGAINLGIRALGSAGGPSYPSPPKIAQINIPQATNFMQNYEAQRMQASIDAWKQRFPLLYQGGAAEIADIARNQQGYLSNTIGQSLGRAGLETPVQGKSQENLAVQLGMNPLTLSQRTSEAVSRNIALNPEWTNKISGGTLATMLANNAQNQNAFGMFLGSQNAIMSQQRATQAAYNTQALLSGLTGMAGNIGQYAINQNMSNALNLGSYGPGVYYGMMNQQAAAPPPSTQSYTPYDPYSGWGNLMWNQVPTPGIQGTPFYGNYDPFNNSAMQSGAWYSGNFNNSSNLLVNPFNS